MLDTIVASAIACVASLVGGFLAAAHVVGFGGDILIWVFPLLCFSYGAMRWLLACRYGGGGCE